MKMLNNIAGELLLKAVGLFICGVLLVFASAGIALFTPARTTLAEALVEQVVLFRNARSPQSVQAADVIEPLCGEEGVAPNALAEVVALPEEEMYPIEQDYKDRLGELTDWYVTGSIQHRQCVYMIFGGVYGAGGREEDLVYLYKWDPATSEWKYVEEWCNVCGALDALGVP